MMLITANNVIGAVFLCLLLISVWKKKATNKADVYGSRCMYVTSKANI